MANSVKDDTWVWVVIQDPGGDEQFLGQLDEESNISFIPAFFKKEDAEQCFLQLHRQKGQKSSPLESQRPRRFRFVLFWKLLDD